MRRLKCVNRIFQHGTFQMYKPNPPPVGTFSKDFPLKIGHLCGSNYKEVQNAEQNRSSLNLLLHKFYTFQAKFGSVVSAPSA